MRKTLKWLLPITLIPILTSVGCWNKIAPKELYQNLNSLVSAEVVKIIDGDTIDVNIDGTSFRVRYIGIDTPEMNNTSSLVRTLAKEAKEENTILVSGKIVKLERDIEDKDRYGRLLRYVWLDETTMVNAELIREGYASVATYPPNVKHTDLFLQLEKEARNLNKGLWR